MALTAEQLQTLKSDILANTDPTVVQAVADGNAGVIADWYNQTAAPDFWVFMSFVSRVEIKDVLDWADYEGLTVSKQATFEFLAEDGGFDPQKNNVRSGLVAIFPAGNANRDLLLDVSTERATYFQKLFSTTATGPAGGNGSAQNSAAISAFAGQSLGFSDVAAALNS